MNENQNMRIFHFVYMTMLNRLIANIGIKT